MEVFETKCALVVVQLEPGRPGPILDFEIRKKNLVNGICSTDLKVNAVRASYKLNQKLLLLLYSEIVRHNCGFLMMMFQLLQVGTCTD